MNYRWSPKPGVLAATVSLLAWCAVLPASAGPGGALRLPGHIPQQAVAESQPIGSLSPTTALSLALVLPLRDQSGLESFLHHVYTPGDPLYGHYLTARQFDDRFGPTRQAYDAVTAYAQSLGLTVTRTYPGRTLLDVSASAGDVERAFEVHLHRYRKPSGREFFAPDADPAVPAEVAPLLAAVVGLDTASRWHTHVKSVPAGQIGVNQIGTGPGGGLTPADINTAYGLTGVTANGSGQTLGLFELAGYKSSDISDYESYYSLPAVPLANVLVDGGPGAHSSGADEVTLDIELQIALASGAGGIRVYEGPNTTTGVIDTYNQIANDNLAKEISTSWGLSETSTSASTLSAENSAFQKMAAQGQSIFAAAGDSGAYDNGSTLSVDDPASQPYMVGCGGTTLTVNAGETYQSETTWNNSSGAGGGGVSQIWAIPSWQAPVCTSTWAAATGGSTTMRNVPDVALDADPNTGYSIIYNGFFYIFGGTSCAAPLWSAFTAAVNQARAANGNTPLGFADPALYNVAEGANYNLDFHDINDGSTNGYYPALVGYDDATGWGSFDGANLLAALSPPPGPPAAPTNLSAGTTSGSTQVSLSWTASAGASSYNVKRSTTSGGSYTTISSAGSVTGTSYTDTTAAAGTAYYYVVTAVNSAGESGNSNQASATVPPAAPTSLAATAGNAQVSLTWTGSFGATSYNVKRSTTSGAETTIASGITSTSYTDTGVSNFTTYYYVATAVDAGGESPNSNEASATPQGAPAPPTNLTATAGNAQVGLAWTGSAGASSYNVYRGTVSGGEGTTPIATAVASTSYTDTSAANGTTYYYEVTAVNTYGESGKSNEASATPAAPPPAPTNLAATAGNAQVGLIWAASTGATSYNVKRSTTSGAETTIHSGVTSTSYSDTSVANGTTYYYEVTAADAGGESAPSNEASATPQGPPPAPTNLSASTTSGSTQVSLAWTASAGASSYNVKRGTTSGGPYTTISSAGSVTATSYTDTTAAAGTPYYYVVTAVNSLGESGNSNQASATVPPVAPTNLQAQGGKRKVSLSWTGSFGAASYTVERSSSSTGPFSVIATGVTGTTYTNGGLPNHTTYYYAVLAADAGGNSPPSNVVSATTRGD